MANTREQEIRTDIFLRLKLPMKVIPDEREREKNEADDGQNAMLAVEVDVVCLSCADVTLEYSVNARLRLVSSRITYLLCLLARLFSPLIFPFDAAARLFSWMFVVVDVVCRRRRRSH